MSVYVRHGRTRYRLRGYVDGSPRSAGTYDTLEELLRASAARARRLARRPTELTVGAWGELWLDRLEEAGRHRAIHTYRQVWRQHVAGSALEAIPVRRLTSMQVRAWVDDLALKRASRGARMGQPLRTRTVRNALRVLSSALEAAAAAGRCPANPSRGVPVPRDTGSTAEERTHLSAAEVERVLAYTEIPVDHRAAIVCAIYTGMRAGELWGLRWEDVQLEGADPQVVVRRNRDLPTKSGRTRRILLLPPAWAALRAWRDATLLAREGAEDEVVDLVTGLPRAVAGAYVWPARGRSGPHARGYDAGWATTWREAMGIRPGVRLHDLRHTCAAHLIQGTWGPPMRLEDVQLVLGHASRTTTEIYAHLAPDGGVAALRRVAEAMGRQDGGEDRVMSLPDPVGRRARDR